MTASTNTRAVLLGFILIAAASHFVRSSMEPKIERSEVDVLAVEKNPETKRSPPPPPPLMQDGRAMFKVVMVGYAGVCEAMNHAIPQLSKGARETWLQTTDRGWNFCNYSFVLDAMQWDGHPIHLHVFGHEGLGFLGQPGSSKDVVFKNAHAIFALTKGRDDTNHSAAVLEGDLTRLHAQGTWPIAEVVMMPAARTSLAPAHELWKTRTLDWSTDLASLFTTLPELLLGARDSSEKL